jgi:DnaT-like ssDNA binding protein
MIVAAIRAMLGKGLSIEQALLAAEVIESREASQLEARRANDRARKAKSRDKANDVSRDVTGSHVTARKSRDKREKRNDIKGHVTSRDLAGARAVFPGEEVDITPLGRKRPTLPKGSDDGGAQARARVGGSRLPDEWVPSNALCDFARGLGFGERAIDEAVAEFRDYWRGVPGQRGRKLDWDATFRNRLRETASKQRGNAHGNGKGSPKGSIVEAGRRLTERLIAERREREMQAGNRVDDGDPAVRFLPGLGR